MFEARGWMLRDILGNLIAFLAALSIQLHFLLFESKVCFQNEQAGSNLPLTCNLQKYRGMINKIILPKPQKFLQIPTFSS